MHFCSSKHVVNILSYQKSNRLWVGYYQIYDETLIRQFEISTFSVDIFSDIFILTILENVFFFQIHSSIASNGGILVLSKNKVTYIGK